jgi:hypothetical protein
MMSLGFYAPKTECKNLPFIPKAGEHWYVGTKKVSPKLRRTCDKLLVRPPLPTYVLAARLGMGFAPKPTHSFDYKDSKGIGRKLEIRHKSNELLNPVGLARAIGVFPEARHFSVNIALFRTRQFGSSLRMNSPILDFAWQLPKTRYLQIMKEKTRVGSKRTQMGGFV